MRGSAGRRLLLRTAKVLGGTTYLCCLWHTITTHIVSFVVCVGDSMQPTINSTAPQRDIVLVDHWSHRTGATGMNDIVIATQPDQPSVFICKRIKAVEGDNVPSNVIYPCKYSTVPKGHVWLEGDNPDSSYDSRHFGPLPYELIHGRVFLRIWPIPRMGLLGSR